MSLINNFKTEKEIVYKNENYLVRDNGAVFRKQKANQRKRPLDEKWTFGKKDTQKGYMLISSEAVHRIVAYAFLGSPPSQDYVVDHIDTNKCNNRPENLRWVTRLQNIILNPITLKRITLMYGSLENFFKNPSSVQSLEQNIAWMRTVSKEEAENCRQQLLKWAEADNVSVNKNLEEWIYKKRSPHSSKSFSLDDKASLTPLAIQRKWKWRTQFPSCPSIFDSDPLEAYMQNLSHGAVFQQNDYGKSLVEIVEKSDQFISVILKSDDINVLKPWSVVKITAENKHFVHELIGLYFELNGAKQEHYKLLDIPFKGDSIDKYL